jgi:tRNA dimethylallyltransferase
VGLKNLRKKMEKIIAIVGPTCTGKSDLSIYLAKVFNGEIVNADSMQVYRYFNIGTAKPDMAARKGIPHHLIDLVEPYEEFNAALFKEKADACISDICSRNKIPIIVGGTGLYLRVLVYGLFVAPKDAVLREALQREYTEDPLKFYEQLKEIDHAYALRISFRDKLRAVRAMEIFKSTGLPMSEWGQIHGFRESHYEVLKLGLKRERSELYPRINKRVDDMLNAGWVDEVEHMLSMGYNEGLKPFSSIGYREILLYIKGLISHEDMVKNIKMHTRHYSKRQTTWFSKEKDIAWHEHPEDIEIIKTTVSEFLKRWNSREL